VVLHRVWRESEGRSDLPVREARERHAENLLLPRRELGRVDDPGRMPTTGDAETGGVSGDRGMEMTETKASWLGGGA
jgi:hypothetical protein